MAYTLTQSINFVAPYIGYVPQSAGVANEPAISIANAIQASLMSPPMMWPWNRNENSAVPTVVGQQDYVIPVTDFSYIEKCTLVDPSGRGWDVPEVYNFKALGMSGIKQRPGAIGIKSITYGTNVTIRFVGVPDQVYTIDLIYQKIYTPFAALGGSWALPDTYIDIYNTLFLAEMFEFAEDAQKAQMYRVRGIGSLLGRAEGLTQMQKNEFLLRYLANDWQTLAGQLRTQQGASGRAQ